MSMTRASIVAHKKCVFCRYWRGNAAVPTKTKNYWEYDTNDRADCLKRRGVHSSSSPVCPDYELDSYKYPKV
jgi:hypothetical protein